MIKTVIVNWHEAIQVVYSFITISYFTK